MIKKFTIGLCLLTFILAINPLHARASDFRKITLKQALDQAFSHNPEYILSLWEYDLNQQLNLDQNLQPKVTINTKPIAIKDGTMQAPTGEMILSMPLSDHGEFSGKISVSLSPNDVQFEPLGAISYNYRFFTPAKSQEEISLDSQVLLDNSLILEVTDVLISLAKLRERLVVNNLNLTYLNEALVGAEVNKNTTLSLQLKQQIRTSEQQLDDLTIEIYQQNLTLNRLLNQSDVKYEPIITVIDNEFNLNQDQLTELALNQNKQLNSAINNLINAEQQLDSIQRSLGWDITADANLTWDFDFENNPTWSVNLVASRDLLPPNLQLEKAELTLAKAQLQVQNNQQQIINQTQQYLDRIRLQQERQILLKNDILAELNDIENTNKLYAAGLATKLELMKHEVNLASLELNLKHNQYDYLNNVLRLFNHCGYNLIEVVPMFTTEEASNEPNR